MPAITPDDLRTILDLHGKWLRGEAGGTRADLTRSNCAGANFAGADLTRSNCAGANFAGANFAGANLTHTRLAGADLTRSDLTDSNLAYADLTRSDLAHADLAHANLTYARLTYARLVGARLNDGVLWEEYVRDVVPALLTAGGQPLAAVANRTVWDCHTWSNCPIHTAFGASELEQVPALYRWQAERFVQFFDARLVPLDSVPGADLDTPVAGRTSPTAAAT